MSMKRPVTWKDVVPAALGVVALIAAMLLPMPFHIPGWVLPILFALCVVVWVISWRRLN